ncbi:short-chain dehydrogenase, partial [Vibrio xuii]
MNSVLITGATSGIGLQLARDYAQDGWDVIACGRNSDVLTQLEQEFSQISGLKFDLTDLQDSKEAVSQLPYQPHLWIFNAGDCEYIDEGVMDAELVKRVFNVNVVGLANAIEACQTHFIPG